MEFNTPQTILPINDLEYAARARKVAERLDDLHAHAPATPLPAHSPKPTT